MKRIFLLVILSVAYFGVCARNGFENYPLPHHPDTLRILAIGNSFSDDGTEYLPALLASAGIHNVILGRLYIGGCSLQRHCEEYRSGSHSYTYSKSIADEWMIVSKEASFLDGLKDEPWDVITMQETSGLSGVYDNYREWLPQLIGIVRSEAVNPKATLAWHRTWAYASNSVHEMFATYGKDQLRMCNAIGDCVDRLKEDFDIQVVIPSGPAIQIARGTSLNNIGEVSASCRVYDLTRDGYHLNRQFGRYIAACAWFETLIKPTLGVSVKRNPYLLMDTEYSLSRSDARLCRKVAVKAVRGER